MRIERLHGQTLHTCTMRKISSGLIDCDQAGRYAPHIDACPSRRSDVLVSPRAPYDPAARSVHGAPAAGVREGSRDRGVAAPTAHRAAPTAAAAPVPLGAAHAGAAGD